MGGLAEEPNCTASDGMTLMQTKSQAAAPATQRNVMAALLHRATTKRAVGNMDSSCKLKTAFCQPCCENVDLCYSLGSESCEAVDSIPDDYKTCCGVPQSGP